MAVIAKILGRFRQWFFPPQGEPSDSATHLGGQGIPTILGVCERCGAVVVKGLHQRTVSGYLCQRCARNQQLDL